MANKRGVRTIYGCFEIWGGPHIVEELHIRVVEKGIELLNYVMKTMNIASKNIRSAEVSYIAK